MDPMWVAVALGVVAVWYLGLGINRIARSTQRQERYLQQLTDTAVMQFYAVEQMYEMSGLHQRFTSEVEKDGESFSFFGPSPAHDLSGVQTSQAWALLLSRMESRMKSAVRIQLTERQSGGADDPDALMLRSNGRAWERSLPMLSNWPRYPRTCWWGTGENPPEDVPTALKR